LEKLLVRELVDSHSLGVVFFAALGHVEGKLECFAKAWATLKVFQLVGDRLG
jgi:hypothetical protein